MPLKHSGASSPKSYCTLSMNNIKPLSINGYTDESSNHGVIINRG